MTNARRPVTAISADVIPTATLELDEARFLEPFVVLQYAWTQTYAADQYRLLLLTYSGHRALDPPRRESLPDCITQLILTRHTD